MTAVLRSVQPDHEHEFEAAVGLPEALPPGERVLWQGVPTWGAMARHVFHLRGVVLYLAAIVALRTGLVWYDTGSAVETARATLWLLVPFGFAAAVLATLAWLAARTTAYTLTNRRVVMRIGIVLTLTFNLPLRRLAKADLSMHTDGTGDLALTLAAPDKIAYVHLWPHARPWHVARPQPMLRCIPQADAVAHLLTEAWAAEAARVGNRSVPASPALAQPA